MIIHGPHVTKTVVVPEHTVEVLDEDAYWRLDYMGNQDPEGFDLYAKVAYPKVVDAQRQQTIERKARKAEHEEADRASKLAKANRRKARKGASS